MLLNSDVAPATGWLNPLYDYMEAHPDVGACQPKIRSYADHKSFEYAEHAADSLTVTAIPIAAVAYSTPLSAIRASMTW